MSEPGIDRGITVSNDLTKGKEKFVPMNGNRVSMYVCGITAYDECHIGHARCYISFDVVRRYLEHKGYEVFHIQNFTDIDDKIINRSNELGIEFIELARRNERSYFEVMDKLNIIRASVYPHATEHVSNMLGVIQKLVDGGYAYPTPDGSVFFDVSSFPGYGKLSGVDLTSDSVSEDDVAAGKKNRKDFALWKAAKEGEPSWESAWGRGRPGWHIECSTMATFLSGPTLDIHGGGHDLLFPHHENEIAQAECFTGEPFVRYWLHNGFVELDKEKMSKSLGNVISVRYILSRFSADALRLMMLSTHYKMPLSYSDDRLAESQKAIERFTTFFSRLNEISNHATDSADLRPPAAELSSKLEACEVAFTSAMDDDFNTPGAIAEVFSMLRAANTALADLETSADSITSGEAAVFENVKNMILKLSGVLGLRLEECSPDAAASIGDLMSLLIDIRKQSREKKDWATADIIRDRLADLGYVIEDGPRGTTWRKKS